MEEEEEEEDGELAGEGQSGGHSRDRSRLVAGDLLLS